MKLIADIDHPTATTGSVMAMMLDPTFRERVCQATRALDYSVDIDANQYGSARVVIDRVMASEVSDFAKKLVGEKVSIRQTEEWSAARRDGSRTAELTITIKGQPAQMLGTMTLGPSADGTGVRIHVQGDVQVKIPLLGRKVEREFSKGILAAIEKEQEVGASWLGDH